MLERTSSTMNRLGVAAVSLVLLATAVAAERVSAQATGMPTFFAPSRGFGSAELGVTLSRPGGGGTALEGRIAIPILPDILEAKGNQRKAKEIRSL